MLQAEPVFRERHAVASITPIIGVNAEDFIDTLPIQNVSTGRPNLMVMLKSLAAIRRVQIDWNQAAKYFATGDKQRGFYLLTQECELPEARVHARKLTRSLEDPATGSAAGAAAAWLVAHKVVESGERIMIEQGREMNRPGGMFVSAEGLGEQITNVRVGGHAVQVAAGELIF